MVYQSNVEKSNLDLVKSAGENIRHIKDPSEAVKLAAVTRGESEYNMKPLRYIENPSLEVIMAALARDGLNLKLVKDPTREMQELALKTSGYALTYIDNPDEDLQIMAVTVDANMIEKLKNPSDEVWKAAIKESAHVISKNLNPSQGLQDFIVDRSLDLVELIQNPSVATIRRILESLRIQDLDSFNITKK